MLVVDDLPPLRAGNSAITRERPGAAGSGGQRSDGGECPDTENYSSVLPDVRFGEQGSLRKRSPAAALGDPVTSLYSRGIGCRDATPSRSSMSRKTKLMGSYHISSAARSHGATLTR